MRGNGGTLCLGAPNRTLGHTLALALLRLGGSAAEGSGEHGVHEAAAHGLQLPVLACHVELAEAALAHVHRVLAPLPVLRRGFEMSGTRALGL